MSEPKRIAILGSTGSIGRQTLQELSRLGGYRVCGLAAGANAPLLAEQANRYHPELLALADPSAAAALSGLLAPPIETLTGDDAMTEMVHRTRPEILLSGIVGSAGLKPTLAGIECGARLAIANKETLVMAGAIVMPAARAAHIDLLPVDSEHSAIFQCLQAGRRKEVRRVVITASGGALRDWPEDKLQHAGVEEALNHPTWNMGQKITIDSATLINKALEVIEAHWLFDLPAEQIEVVIHPQSIIHSYVEFCDGSVIAQMGQPDMTLPIAYALEYPHRPVRNTPPLNLAGLGELTFLPCEGRFARSIELAYKVIRQGGLSGAVLNGANEAAVHAFLTGKISFGQIVPLVEEILNRTPEITEITLDALIQADLWAREQLDQRVGLEIMER